MDLDLSTEGSQIVTVPCVLTEVSESILGGDCSCLSFSTYPSSSDLDIFICDEQTQSASSLVTASNLLLLGGDILCPSFSIYVYMASIMVLFPLSSSVLDISSSKDCRCVINSSGVRPFTKIVDRVWYKLAVYLTVGSDFTHVETLFNFKTPAIELGRYFKSTLPQIAGIQDLILFYSYWYDHFCERLPISSLMPLSCLGYTFDIWNTSFPIATVLALGGIL